MPDEPDNAIHLTTCAEWRAWLEQHHIRPEGVWLISFKKGTGKPRVAYEEAVEEALCFGWIDSTQRTLDDERAMLWFAPRTMYRLVEAEQAAYRAADSRRVMAPAGLAKVEAAKQDGSWQALDAVEALDIPPDLAAALRSYPAARTHFDAFPRSVKRSILEWIASAKTPTTRAKRVEKTARLAQENIRTNQWRRSSS